MCDRTHEKAALSLADRAAKHLFPLVYTDRRRYLLSAPALNRALTAITATKKPFSFSRAEWQSHNLVSIMTVFHSTQLGSRPAANNNCNHPKLSIGLDRAHCPDCNSDFLPWSQEYQNALHPQGGSEEKPSPSDTPPESQILTAEYKVGDRVSILYDPPHLLYQIVKLQDDGHASVEALVKGTGCDRRRVALWKLRPSCAVANRDDQAEQMSNETERPLEDSSGTVPEETERPLEDFSGTVPEEAERPLEQPPGIEERDSRHTPASGWVEKYLVKGRWEHHRYCWQLGHKGKTRQVHIPKDSGKLKAVRDAIAQRKSPLEIVEFLKPCRNKRFEKCSRGRK